MRSTMILRLAVTFLFSLAAAVSSESRSVDVFAWPIEGSKPQTLAQVSYTSTNASVKSYNAPAFTSQDDIVRVGFYHASGSWSGIATSASNFAADIPKTLQLHVGPDGELYHIGFKTAPGVSQGKGAGKSDLTVEVVPMKKGPVPALNKPVVLSADGKEEGKEPEKTFLQKYWWAIALFLVFQLVVGGTKGE
ncbi:uncharacterized protein MYCGRDRAFT_69277 [Zymoseptoria tritici IPO323]|uniref:Uncharacterized protein n=1 Tax=Zymoseptoria tritici (strain CBS 115943 / IPO323) TaxID=336722 RepID=F9X611_ZYMTI|nr:uncharacterized protein MYCGRDRAFT_69277 [Zymoseptoria tritici IPO323]EGP89613.1 hypothetical protein MYCGRDRAFT_69277 [Zymoseptoria tritici IPO323]